MNNEEIIKWLLEGDVSIQYQTYRDLLGIDKDDLQKKIAYNGWGKVYLSKRNPEGHWGLRFYQPKWISTHYTLLDLRNLNLNPGNEIVQETINMILDSSKAKDGGIQLGPSTMEYSDICVNGMFLNYASYFKIKKEKIISLVDNILNEIMPDGGFNCITARNGSKHSSLHTTLSVLEGLNEFLKAGHSYRINEIQNAKDSGEEFILAHQLFMSDKTGEVINKDFLKLTYPGRWKYDILRALDYFRYSDRKWDNRMESALNVIIKKRRTDGRWNLQAAYPGKVHVKMEDAGKPSRWNTLRSLRVLNHFGLNN